VYFCIKQTFRIRSQNRNGSKGSVRDLWGTNFCKNPRKSASLPCPFHILPLLLVFCVFLPDTRTYAYILRASPHSFMSSKAQSSSWEIPFNSAFLLWGDLLSGQCSYKSNNLCDLAISLAYPSQELGGLLLVVPMYMVITTRHTAPCALDYTVIRFLWFSAKFL
jgi:hypothetical protein